PHPARLHAHRLADQRALRDPAGRSGQHRACPVLLAQALSNLIDNALKYAPVDGTIDVAVRRRADGALETAVTDNGPGIDDAEKTKVFERFYRGDASRGTPGVGRPASGTARGAGAARRTARTVERSCRGRGCALARAGGGRGDLLAAGRAAAQMSAAMHRNIVRVGRVDADHAPLRIAVAEKAGRRRGEFAEIPAGIDPLQHGGYEGALQVGAGRQL